MTLSGRLAIPVLAAAALVGCGSAGDAVASKPPQTVLREAAQKQGTTSFRFTLDGKFNVDTSQARNLSPDDRRPIGLPVGGASVKGRGEQESAKRQLVDAELAGGSEKTRVVNYDGSSYLSRDGGKTYIGASAGSITGGLNISPSQLSDVAKNVTNVKDLGRRTVDGQDCEHLQAPVTQAQLAALLGGAGGSSGGGSASGQGADLIKQLVQIRRGVLDVDVRRSDGALIRGTGDLAVGFDLDRLAGLFGAVGAGAPSGIPGGSVSVEVSLDSHFSDYGAGIHVTKPAASPSPTP
ncbi:MAG: hypothetical protein NVS3B18_03110 [Candidatus Dormibacteria bacterium]